MTAVLEIWISYFYMYLVGGIFFVIGLLITHKAGSMTLKKKNHRYYFRLLIFGFFYFMILHALLIFAGLYW
ncbi:MAG: hypothetical protein FJ213_05925 [Ignavibacteria bacterium]|nr:hypothetical protein [Ignavibacteria bacterium]